MKIPATTWPYFRNLAWWCRTAVVVHSALFVLLLAPIILFAYIFVAYPISLSDLDPIELRTVMKMGEAAAYPVVQLLTLFLFIGGWRRFRASLGDGARAVRRASVTAVILQLPLLCVRIVEVAVNYRPHRCSDRSTELNNIVVVSFLYGGYLLMTFIPSLAVLWLVYRSHESETRGFKIALVIVVGVFVVTIASLVSGVLLGFL